jgi:hypothetical protein
MTTFIKGKYHRDEARQLIAISDGDAGVISVSLIPHDSHSLIMLEPTSARATANALLEAARIAEENESN